MAVKVNRGRVLGALSMTPLIDVVFLLLIFFLVATRLSQEDQQLDVPLPSASNAKPMTSEPQELVVNIDESGAIYVNSQFVDPSQFEDLLRTAIVNNPVGQYVIIRADKRVQLQAPVNVMDICLKLGASYSLVTEEGS